MDKKEILKNFNPSLGISHHDAVKCMDPSRTMPLNFHILKSVYGYLIFTDRF